MRRRGSAQASSRPNISFSRAHESRNVVSLAMARNSRANTRTCGGAGFAHRATYMTKRLAFLAVVMLSGCNLYWGGGDDTCNEKPSPLLPGNGFGYRDPETGYCQSLGGGGC